MKNYFKYTKYLALTMFLAMSSSLFATDFNEERKVIIPKYANAVYRDLTVLNRMYLETDENSNRTFLLELGKRPTYFWNPDKMFYLFQTQTLNINQVQTPDESNMFTIDNVTVNNGSFISDGMRPINVTTGGNYVISANKVRSDSNLFINTDPTNNDIQQVNVNFTINNDRELFGQTATHHLYTHKLGYQLSPEESLDVKDLHIGRLSVKDHPFPSPKALVYYSSTPFVYPTHYWDYAPHGAPQNWKSYYRLKGTARDFQLAMMNNPVPVRWNRNTNIPYLPTETRSVKHYYGPWKLYPRDSNGYGGDPRFGSFTSIPYTCPAIQCIKEDPSYVGAANAFTHPYVDPDDGIPACWHIISKTGSAQNSPTSYRFFDCEDLASNYVGQLIDWEGFGKFRYYKPCYDYTVIGYVEDQNYDERTYDNGGNYEFKVEEIYSVVGSTVTLISQNPVVRTESNEAGQSPMPLLQGTVGEGGTVTWVLNNPEGDNVGFIFINGQYQQLKTILKANENDFVNICFKICNGGFCDGNMLYTKMTDDIGTIDNAYHRVLKGGSGAAANNWPDYEGPKQELHIFTHTLGFCPNQVLEDDEAMQEAYGPYMQNYEQDNGMTFINAYKGLAKPFSDLADHVLPSNYNEGSTQWKTPLACVRRLVICNAFTSPGEMTQYNRNYKLFTTDF